MKRIVTFVLMSRVVIEMTIQHFNYPFHFPLCMDAQKVCFKSLSHTVIFTVTLGDT